MVPDGRDEVGVADAGEATFRAEGYGNAARQSGRIFWPAFFFTGEAKVKVEVPFAVEIQPAVTDKLGAGVFGAGL